MSYNNLFPASSLLGTPVVSTPVASAQQNATPTFDLPKIGILPVGHYDSVIVDVAEAIQNGQVVGVDCFHQLTDSSGTTYHVRFRYYAPREVDALVETIVSYGLTGSLGSLLQGLQEDVDVASKAGSASYMSIANRSLKTVTQTSATASSSIVAPVPSSTTTASKRKGGLAARLKTGTKPHPQASTAASLLDDDDEWDDMFDEDED